jgi:signal transduction histidine kinase/ActR/RegA family two-component response regulator
MRKKGRARSAEDEVATLRDRLQEAQDTLEAIRLGHVEALLVEAPNGPRVYTLEGADHRYRRLVETMNEGALLINAEALVLYSNAAFATLVAGTLDNVIGRSLLDFVDARSRPAFKALLASSLVEPAAEEITLRDETGLPVPTFISMSPNEQRDPGVSVLVTNLTTQKRNEQIVASERLASSILEQAAEAIVVCDETGMVIRASRAARRIAAGLTLRQHVLLAFPLSAARDDAEHPALRALAGQLVASVEMALNVPGREPLHVLCTAAPLLSEREVLGCVMSMTDITLQKQAEAERSQLLAAERAARAAAERARHDAEVSNRSKDEFLATVSHELRTPLNSIVGWSRLLSSGSLPEERRQHAVDVIRRNADAQARLVEDLLDVSRIISGQLQLDVKTVPLSRVIASVIDSVRPALDAKQLRIHAEMTTEDVTISGDETRLQQVVWNLVSNATKFTPAKGSIVIELSRIDSGIQLVVRDDGEGIRTEFLPYVFDRFRQADAGIDRMRGGLGLGLAISRHLVELHGGTIAVDSKGPGTGATFTVRLPQRSAPSATEAPRQLRESDAGVVAGELQDLSRLHVLLVEDDEDSRDLFAAILTKCGARVTSANSGHRALQVLETELPDVLVSDIGMPHMDGYSLIRHVRNLPAASAKLVPALALTAYARSEDERLALEAGFQMHLAKPVDPVALAAAIGRLARSA